MPETFTIYGLQDPRNREFRYVGLSGDVAARLKTHVHLAAANSKQAGTATKRAWLKELADQGLGPYLVILEVANTRKQGLETEKRWIAKLSGEGQPLTNREARGGRFRAPCLLGSFLFEVAEKRGVLGVGEISTYIERETGYVFGRGSISNYVNDVVRPRPIFGLAFYHAFSLNELEATRFAHIYAFNEEPSEEMLEKTRANMEAGLKPKYSVPSLPPLTKP